MSDLENYCERWHLETPSLIAKTATGEVYKVYQRNRPLALKILTPLGQKDEANGAIALRHFKGNGVVDLLTYDEKAHLLSFADGKFLKELVVSGKDAEATEIICEVLEKIHGVPKNVPPDLITMKQNFESLFNHAKLNAQSLLMDAARTANHLLETEQDRVVLHGDIHHKNILESSTKGWLAIDPKGLVGERAYDFANVFYNPDDQPMLVESHDRILQTGAIFSRRFDIKPRRILEFAFAYGALSACWAVEDGLKPDRRLRIAGLIRNILLS